MVEVIFCHLSFVRVGPEGLACFHSLFCKQPLLGQQAQACLQEDERCEAELNRLS